MIHDLAAVQHPCVLETDEDDPYSTSHSPVVHPSDGALNMKMLVRAIAQVDYLQRFDECHRHVLYIDR